MSRERRLKVCYLVPGHDLVASMGPTRNVLSVAEAMAEFADVKVAFRRIVEGPIPDGVTALEISPSRPHDRRDDAATSGMGYLEFYRYLRDIRRFCKVHLQETEVVLEKSWLLSGLVSSRWLRADQLGIPVENIVQDPITAARGSKVKRLRLQTARWFTTRFMANLPAIIAETPWLKSEIVANWHVRPERVAVAPLGVDRLRFRPRDKQAARDRLGLHADSYILLYVGVLDWTHDLAPLLTAVDNFSPQGIEVHVIGDGSRYAEYAAMARSKPTRIRLHGRVLHEKVPDYIAAADLCLAPYQATAFASGEVGYYSLKIPEYLACGRPVVTTPGQQARSLISHENSGLFIANEVPAWRALLSKLPRGELLLRMNAHAAAVHLPDWRSTAKTYLEIMGSNLSANRI